MHTYNTMFGTRFVFLKGTFSVKWARLVKIEDSSTIIITSSIFSRKNMNNLILILLLTILTSMVKGYFELLNIITKLRSCSKEILIPNFPPNVSKLQICLCCFCRYIRHTSIRVISRVTRKY